MTTNGHSHGTHASNHSSNHVVPLLINGKEVTNETTFDVVSPVSGKLIWKGSSVSKRQAIEAVEAAQAAFPAWSKTKPSFRRDILLKASDILKSRGEEVCEYMDIETGSTKAMSTYFNVPASIEQLRDVAGRIVTVTGNIPVCAEEGKSALMYKEPYGVVFGIAPWNSPFILGFRAISYALAAGNTCVLKGSEMSPRCFWAIGSILKAAGLPDGVLNVIFHRPQDAAEVTSAIIEHPFVKKINFTGSTATGSIVAAQAGKFLKPVLMELGGKAPAIVLEDANLEKAAEGCAVGAFLHSGQICMSTERILVHSSIAEKFREALKAAMEKIYGKESSAPILVNAPPVQKNKKLVEQALSKGAKILTGDLNAKEHSDTRMRPIVVDGVTKDMDLYQIESFGPTVSLIVVESEEEAIEIANDTEYGLTSAVFTEDLAAGLRVAKQIETGAVHINNMTVHDESNLPHGGAKKSGWGRFNGSAGIEEFLRIKCVTWSD
ncbi:hypothetical protein HO173_008478 [Letharia columbiana]|uniref:Aldehyde dehydrogenase domain-containing protein n=1 Tax=Letharia columbiana TaxID=112416 RepID=A0A8H6FR74_9LECA|nr:uncharacterized protein HO173_008478 [Letharia columbiana]KAF6233189.1 hypothetical protein HO173_008478 [Letharia columbiana]